MVQAQLPHATRWEETDCREGKGISQISRCCGAESGRKKSAAPSGSVVVVEGCVCCRQGRKTREVGRGDWKVRSWVRGL